MIDEAAMSQTVMNSVLKTLNQIPQHQLTMISTPSGKPFQKQMREFSDWMWWEQTCKSTNLGKLLYG